MRTDLSTYRRSQDFYTPKMFLVTVKSFDLQKIRARYLKSRAGKTGRIGSVERREVSRGGLVFVEISAGRITKSDILAYLPEPRGVDVTENMLAVSSENTVHIISHGKRSMIEDPWFSYIHTLQFDKRKNPGHLLVSSSGFDCIFEYSLHKREKTWEWFAWENGFNKGFDPRSGEDILLTRQQEVASSYEDAGIKHLLISDPRNQTLPTANRAAFINSVVYDALEENKLLATFFHEGAVYSIDMQSGMSHKIMDGMKSPHGGRNYRDAYMATSTASGEVLMSAADDVYSFASFPGKAAELGAMEWLQNSAPLDDCIITIDANRNSFVLFDPDHKLIDMVPFDPDWAIQDIAEVRSPATLSLIKEVKGKL
ncbi:MAG: hypothetical protein HQ565_01285 [Bacteroidetes bacterium]|nr:hypothetical protein [Bacteroidota bacterium]